jgi:type II secretory pathway predicted ATPase ExeA
VVIYLPNPSIGVRGMMHHLVSALGHVPRFHAATLIPQAADALATEYAEKGRAPVVAIDEAHLLDNQQMEAVRMLTNHQMDSGAPFSAVLIGQPTLRQLCASACSPRSSTHLGALQPSRHEPR